MTHGITPIHSASELASARQAAQLAAEMYPDLDHRAICQVLVQAELDGGLDIHSLVAKARMAA